METVELIALIIIIALCCIAYLKYYCNERDKEYKRREYYHDKYKKMNYEG